MSTDFGNNQGGVGALSSGTAGNPNQAGLPVGYNRLPPQQGAARKQAASTMRERRLAAQAGGQIPAAIQATLRVDGATVAKSDVIRFAAGDLFIASTGGVLAGAEPALAAVGTAQAAITDGAAKWQPLCERTAAPQSDTLAVVVTDNAGASPFTQYNAYITPELFELGSAPKFRYVSQGGTLSRWQSYLLNEGGVSDNGLGANGLLGHYGTRVFVTNSDVIDIGYFSSVAGFPDERWKIWVNDKPISEGALVPTVNGSPRFLRLVLGGGRRKRRVRVACPGRFIQTYIAVPADCTLEKPTDPGWLSLDVNDSFGFTELAGTGSAHHDFSVVSGLRLGFEHIAHSGIGGTSYGLANGAKRSLRALAAAGEFAGLRPNCVRYGLGYNAAGAAIPPSKEADDALYCWQYFDDQMQDGLHIIRGCWYARPGLEAAQAAQSNALRAKFEQWANPRSAFIDPLDGSITLGDGTSLRASGQPWLPTNAAAWMIPPAGGDFDGAHISAAAAPNFIDLDVESTELVLQAFGT